MPTLADVLRQTGYSQDGTLATPTPTESPMTKALADHIKSIPQKFNENQAYQMELLGKAFPGNTYESMMTQGDPKAMAELAMQTPFNAMVAYHGTPHNILGKFDISKVGTGEGNQSYGHGMYFAENPKVAEFYKDALGTEILLGNKPLLKANKLVGTTKNQDLDKYLRNYDGDVEKIKSVLTQTVDQFSQEGKPSLSNYYQNILNDLNKISNKLTVKNTSNLYKVDIPNEYIPKMIDFDKPLQDQPKDIQNWVIKKEPEAAKTMFTGASLRKFLTSPDYSKQSAEELSAMGYKGIRYLDEFSRKKGGTSNFVVFDPSEVKILEKNSKSVSRKELIEEQVNKLKD